MVFLVCGFHPSITWPRKKVTCVRFFGVTIFANWQEYDLEDPKASFEKVGRMILKEMVGELPQLYELPSKEVRDSIQWMSNKI